MGNWPRKGTGQPNNPQPAKSDCNACKGFGGQYEKNETPGKPRVWVDCGSCKGSGKG